MDLLAAAEAEVVERHRFFVHWFTGRAEPAQMVRTARLFAPDFRIIGPDGRESDGPATLASIEERGHAGPQDFAIRIEIRDSRMVGTHSALVLYDEHQSGADRCTARRSSAIFSAAPALPEGVVWRHLHETWLPERA